MAGATLRPVKMQEQGAFSGGPRQPVALHAWQLVELGTGLKSGDDTSGVKQKSRASSGRY